MYSRWQLQEAKQRFSELIRSVEADGPQVVTRHGEDVAVVISIAEYRHLRHEGAHVPGCVSWIRSPERVRRVNSAQLEYGHSASGLPASQVPPGRGTRDRSHDTMDGPSYHSA